MNGYELTEQIRGLSQFANLPIIAVTSLAGEEDIQRGLQAGITKYLVKLDREMLTATVMQYLKTVKPSLSGISNGEPYGRYN